MNYTENVTELLAHARTVDAPPLTEHLGTRQLSSVASVHTHTSLIAGGPSPVFDPGHVQQSSGCHHLWPVVVLVTDIQHFCDTGLDDQLGTLVAGEESHVHRATFHVCRILVQDGIELCMADCVCSNVL